jgi:putative FmdB family regulatory protein
MPQYDYKCPKCGTFEIEQSMKDEQLKTCPKCGSAVRRLISLSGIVLKGSGFYSTDNRKGKYKDESKSVDKPKENKSEAVSAAPAKPETKTSPTPKSSKPKA